MIADANTFRKIDQFLAVSGLRPGIWRVQWMNEQCGEIVHWQFHWVSPGPLDLDALPTIYTYLDPRLHPLGDWEKINAFSVDSGKISVFDRDMLQRYIAHTGDERLVIDVCQDPFSARMGYQGVLPGGFFSEYEPIRDVPSTTDWKSQRL